MSDAGFGQFDPTDGASDYNATVFVIQQMIARISTITLARVVKVTNAGTLIPAGTVDVQPLVNLLDGIGNASPHGVVHGLLYFRAQAGASAVVMDPEVGDIGFVGFADRDISAVKAARAQANPGSRRRFDMADGIFFGGLLNGAPTQAITFLPRSAGIDILSPAIVLAETPTTNTTGNLVAGTGCSGSFTTPTGQVVTVQDGIIVNIF